MIKGSTIPKLLIRLDRHFGNQNVNFKEMCMKLMHSSKINSNAMEIHSTIKLYEAEGD